MAQLTQAELLQALTALAGVLATAGVQTDPAANAILADTAALGAGKYLFQAFISSSVAGAFELEHRNAGNTANVFSQRVHVPASDTSRLPGPAFVLTLAASERVRVRNVAALTGNVQATISYTRIGDA